MEFNLCTQNRQGQDATKIVNISSVADGVSVEVVLGSEVGAVLERRREDIPAPFGYSLKLTDLGIALSVRRHPWLPVPGSRYHF